MVWLPPDVTSLRISAAPDLRVLLFTIGVSLITGVLFGLLPAIQSTKSDVAPTLKDQVGNVVGAGGGHVRFRKALVTAQVTLSLLLLVGAGLVITSLRDSADLGARCGARCAFRMSLLRRPRSPSLALFACAALFIPSLVSPRTVGPGLLPHKLATVKSDASSTATALAGADAGPRSRRFRRLRMNRPA